MGTQKYIEGQQYAGQVAQDVAKQNALAKLQAAQDKSTAAEKDNAIAAQKAAQQAAIKKLQAAQDKSTMAEKAEHAALANGTVNPPANPPAGGSGGGSGSGSGSGGKSYTSGSVTRAPIGSLGNSSATSTPTVTPTPIEPDTTVHDNYKAAMEAANDRLKQAYEYQQSQLGAARDNALREAYIKQQMVERRYPEQLSAAGINGGAAQGLLARNNADYANQRTAIHGDYLNNLGAAGQTYQQGIMKNNEDFLNTMAAYQQSLDEMRRKWELEQLEKSGLLTVNPYNRVGYGFNTQPLSAQDYLTNLRNNYGNLFK